MFDMKTVNSLLKEDVALIDSTGFCSQSLSHQEAAQVLQAADHCAAYMLERLECL